MAHTVAIIEDDDFLRSLAVSKLEKAGYTVLMASNGEDGLKLVQEKKPELLILDLMLPTMSGFDVLASVRKDAALATLKIVVFSNLGDDADMKKCQALGIQDYLIKANFTLDELVQKIGALLA